MKRAIFLYSLLFIFPVSGAAAFGQSDARKVCPFSIIGLWRSEATNETNPIFFSFSPEGWVRLLSHSSDTLPQDFDVITEVRYKLDKPAAPKRIEFTAWRGNDAFAPGVTLMDITEYNEDSFTTLNPASGQRTRWVREQTHRYFLTFAARNAASGQDGPAFVMWTVLDGRKTEIEALGAQLTRDDAGETIPVFGPIPAELYNHLTEESDKDRKSNKDETAIMRLELTHAEFERTHKVFEVWDKYVKTRALPYGDPYMNGTEFIKRVAESLNQCGEKIKLEKLKAHKPGGFDHANLPQQTLEYIRGLRKKNDELHVTDGAFPWGWRPMLQLPGQ